MQIQEAKVARLIAKLQLSGFQLKEYKKMDDCQYSNPIYPNQPTGKILQLTYLHKLSTDHLITHLEVQISSPQIFSSMFEFGEIEGNSLPTRSLCGAIRWCGVKQSNQGKFWMVGCACITHALKISLLLKRQFLVIYSDILELKKQKDRQSNEENIMKIIKHTIKEINICGYHLNVSPSASDLIPLLNISQSFKLAYRYHEAAETDVFSSLALIAARRFVQAAEMLRQVSNFYLNSYQPPNNYLDFSKLEKTFNKEECKDNLQVSLISRSFSTGRVLEGGPFLYKAAKIQLLLADTISQPSLLGAKLEAYNRANAFANGVTCPPKINIRIDYHDAILSIGQSILPFLLKILNDKTEILKISALKSIQFFFQNLGCSLGGWVGTTLKKIISIYPKQRQRVSEVGAVGGRWKLIIDHTNRVLQSLVSLIGSLNRKFLLTIFEDIIITSISEEYRNELRLYLLRFAEKIIQICGSDLKLSLPYLSYLFTLVSPGYNNNSLLPHHVNQHLTQLSNRVLLLVKQKVLKNYQHTQLLSSICIWIREALISHCETESSTGLSLHQLLELTIAIYTYNKKTTANPIQAVIYLLNLALSQPKLPFQKLLETLVVLLANNQQFDRQDLCSQITIRGIARLRGGGVKLKQLKVLQKVLEMVDQVKGEWLEDFLQCIPHSNFDEIYLVFDLLFRKSVLHLNKERLQAVIQTLFNQYTVKGKAHQLSKQCMITHLLQNMKNSLLMLIQVCLFGNPEPQIAAYSRIKMFGKQQLVDSKQFRLKSQIFSEKINLLLMVFTKKQLLIEQLTSIFTVELICKLHKSFGQILRNSNNAKVKVKVLLLINYIISLLIDINRPPALSPSYILFYKAILQLLKGFVLQSKHTKLHQYCAANLALVFQLIPRNGTEKQQLQNLMFMDQPVSIHFKVPADLTASSTQALLGNQLLKIWPCLLVLLNSSWQNIRQTAMSSLLYSLRQGLSGMNSSHKNKLTQLVKVLLSQLLYSPDHTERLTGLKLLCLTLGMGRNYTKDQELARQIRQNSYSMKQQVQRTLQLSDDWNPEIVHYSRLVTQICLSEWQRENLLSRKLHKPGQNSLCLQQYYLDSQEKRQNNSDIIGNLQEMLKLDQSGQEQNQESYPPLTAQQLAHISQFKQAIENIKFEDCSSMAEKESFVQEQHYLDANDEQQHSDKETSNRSQEQPLEFQDLGIIELDDEQWAQEENQLKITQKLPLKKIYKLSPNLASSSKHHRLSNNRLYPSEIQQRIVVDQVDANIPTPVVQQKQIYRGAEKQSGKQWTKQLGLSWEEVNDKQWPQSRVNKNKGREKKGSKKGRSSK